MTDWADIRDGVREGMSQVHIYTLRDQFAMAALQSMDLEYEDMAGAFASRIANRAYEVADAMMKARLDPPK